MKTLFVPCTVDGLHKHSGSALLRSEWVCKYWDDAEVFDGSQSMAKADLVVFQKAYVSDRSRALIHRCAALRDITGGPMIAFDLCDPDFLDRGYLTRMLDVLPLFDFATAPTQPLVDWLGAYLPAYLIPDRIDPEIVKLKRPAFFDTNEPRLVWFGYEGNRGALLSSGMFKAVQEMGLQLTVIGVKKPKPFTEFVQDITEFDILLNPRPNSGKYRYKSDNKSLVAWACNVAVAETIEELNSLINPEKRRKTLETVKNGCIMEERDIKLSQIDWENLYKKERIRWNMNRKGSDM